MEWDDLRIFLWVARCGQIARAAHALKIDPTTVSRRLRRLEASLSEMLFEQHHGERRMTVTGRRLLTVAEAMERQVMAFPSQKEEEGILSGSVRVSASEGFGTWFVAAHLGRLAAEHPTLTIDLVASSGFLSPSRRETDVAILLARPRKGPLVTRKLTDYGLRVYASHNYLAAHEPIAAPSDLTAHALIGYVPDFIYAPELDYLEEIAPGLTPTLRSTSINAQHQLIRAGAGIGVLPCFIGDGDSALVPQLPQIRIKRSFWIVTHEDTRNVPRVRGFTDWLVALTASQRAILLG